MSDSEAGWENYESGPFCRHWSHPADCDQICTCGHGCAEHGHGECGNDECTCEEFKDTE